MKRLRFLWPGVMLLAAPLPLAAIVNGTPPAAAHFRESFAWAVALEYAGSDGVCTGQLIAPAWVLTAAHCTSSDGVQVRAGSINRTLGEKVAVVQAIRHPQFDPATGRNDVGLLRLARPLTLPPVRLVTAAQAPTLLREGARAVIAGWGRRSSSLGHSADLIVSDVELRGLQLADGRIGFYDAVSGPCGGDSGGPLLLQQPRGTWVLAGVASRVVGDICAQGGGVSLYVNVAEVRAFVDAHVAGLPR